MSVLALLMALVNCAPENYDCALRLQPMATAIVGATRNAEEQAWLATQARFESFLFDWVINDEPRCHEGWNGVCDGGAAWSPWQLHFTDRQGGVARAARIALSRWRYALGYCGSVEGAFALLATGHKCTWSEAPKRAEALAQNIERLQ